MKGGLIEEVRRAAGPAPDVTVVPGFIDLQVNGVDDIDVAVASVDQLDALAAKLARLGVTSWCPTLTSAPLGDLESAVGRIAAARDLERAEEASPRARIAGVHLEGPFITVPGAHPLSAISASLDLGWLERITEAHEGIVRIVTLAPELDGALEAISSLTRHGVVVALGHSACSFEQAGSAADAGARLVTHLGNAMGSLTARAPGLLGAALADDRLYASVIADLVHLHRGFMGLAWKAKGAERMLLVTDSVAVLAGHAGPIELAEQAVAHEGPARLADGTLAGATTGMAEAIQHLVRDVGIRSEDALRAATALPGSLLGLDDRGRLEPGALADIVVLDADYRVCGVWIGGVPVSGARHS